MSDITGSYVIPTNPAVTVSIEYESKRQGDKVYFRFKAALAPMTDKSFAYNIKLDITLNTTALLRGGTVKNPEPTKWNEPISVYFPSKTGWYVKNTSNEGAVPCTCRFYSTQTSGSESTSGKTVFVPLLEGTSTERIYFKVKDVWKQAEKIYVRVKDVWKQAEKIYVKVNGIWKEV